MATLAPTLRRRFVTRARSLLKHRSFVLALEHARVRWQEEYPNFPLEPRHSAPPAEPADWTKPPMPPALAAALESAHTLREVRWPEREASPMEVAGEHWRNCLLRLCWAWWPPQYFPNWLDPRFNAPTHPALHFVGACMLFEPRRVDPEVWIDRRPLQPIWIDEVRAPHDLEPNDWERAYWELRERVLTAIRRGHSLTPEILRTPTSLTIAPGEHSPATTEAGQARSTAAGTADLGLWVLPILPGMRSADYRSAEREALRHAEHDWRLIARELHTRRTSISEISRLFGVSRRSIDRLVGNAGA